MMGGRFGGGAEDEGGRGGGEGFHWVVAAAPPPTTRPEAEPARERVVGEALVPCEGRRLLSLRGEA